MKKIYLAILLVALLLTGCGDATDPCASARADICYDMSTMVVSESAIVPTATQTRWYIDFKPKEAEEPLFRLSCVTDSSLESCEKSFTMPDLDRLPHGEAVMTTSNSSTESLKGSFRLDEILGLTDGESYRVTGRIVELHFEPPGDSVVLTEGQFDVVAKPSQQ